MSLYAYKNQYVNMTPEEVTNVLNNYEKSLRTNKFNYIEQQAFQSQITDIKKVWPEDFQKKIKDMALAIAKGSPITPNILRKAIVEMGEFVANERSAFSGLSSETEFRQISAEICLATIFGRAPDATVTPSSIPVSHRYQENGKLVRAKIVLTPKKLVVNVSEIKSADIYMMAMYVEAMKTSILLGYATQEDLLKAKVGDKISDPDNCPWKNKAYYLPLEELRPMSQFFTECGLTDLPVGIAMESVPNLNDLPVLSRKELQDMMRGQTKDQFDFLGSVGISSAAAPSKAPTTVSAPAAPTVKKNLGDLEQL